MSEALRFNSDKPMMSYFMRSFPKMAEAVARVKEMGAIKYNDGNWRLGNKPDDEYWNSMFRHLDYIFGGEFYDSDTGCLHIAHAVWNLCALLELNYPDLPARDDAIWAERAKHWAEEKKKRETAEEERKDEEAVEGWSDACAERWAEQEIKFTIEGVEREPSFMELQGKLMATRDDEVRPREEAEEPEFQGSLERFVAAMDNLAAKVSDSLFVECPMCGRRISSVRKHQQGLECVCGEVFGVPIDAEGKDPEILDFFLAALPEPADFPDAAGCMYYAEFIDQLGIWDLPSIPEAAKAADNTKPAWTTFIALRGGAVFCVPPCPMCGHSDSILRNGERGLECPDCGEIFNVPIAPENTDGPETVRFGTKGERRPMFVNTTAELFEQMRRE